MDDFLARWQEWHARREERLTAPDGFLTITALHWLDDRPRRFAELPGEWCQVADGVEVRLADGERLDVDGRRLTGRHVFTGLDADGVRAVHGDVVVEVAVRGGSAMLRPRRPDHELRLDHAPTPTYPPSRRWVLPARFLPYDESRPLPVDT